MIDITQIRVGNIVYDNLNKRDVLIDGIETGHNTVWVDYNNGSEIYPLYVFQIDEIKLTENELSNFGFYHHNASEYWFNMCNDKHFGISKCLVQNLEFLKVGSWYYSDNFIEVKYLHQFQNLYYSLMGEDLRVLS